MPYAPPHPVQTHPGEHGDSHAHPPHLGHHWATPVQQFEAGKLGMWLFLATEVLLFGGLFCAYAVWRGNHPELFKYGSQFLNTNLGATNTAVLILSSLTMAWGVTAAQQNKRGVLILMLSLTLAGAATFLVIKYFEYSHKFHEGYYPGIHFYDVPGPHAETFWGEHDAAHADNAAAPAHDDSVTHSTAGSGATNDTANGSDHTPASGHAADAPAPSSFEVQTISVTAPEAPATPPVEAPTFAPAARGPAGLAPDAQLVEEPFKFEQRHHTSHIHPLKDPNRPVNAQMFFNIYFMMTGLHGVHVLVGMIVITWLLLRAVRGDFNSEYFTPVDLGGLYWHIVDLIWIFLFPLFYLI